MSKKPSLFKFMFFVFLAFYLSSLIVLLFVFTSNIVNYPNLNILIGAIIGVSFIAMIFFSPILLFVTFFQYWMKNNKLKNFISFLLVIIYGYIIFIQTSLKSSNLTWFTDKDKILNFFLLSIPSTALFLIILICLVSRDCKIFRVNRKIGN